MRLFLSILLVFSVLCGFAQARELKLNSIDVRYYGDTAFKRISEYFTGVENRGGDCIERTDQSARGGMYWVLRLNQGVRHLSPGCSARLSYILSDSPERVQRTLDLRLEGVRSREIYLGITGMDWPDGAEVVGWSLDILGPSSQILLHQENFLWSYVNQKI